MLFTFLRKFFATRMTKRRLNIIIFIGLMITSSATIPSDFSNHSLENLLNSHATKLVQRYINNTWGVLTRNHKELLKAAMDPKLSEPTNKKWIVYVPRVANLADIKDQLKQRMPLAYFNQLSIQKLPEDISRIQQHGLLYLPNPYVVPGGRFNEMYGWDSYFIILGLLQDNQVQLAKGMVDNFIYEINYYGKILNANRSYFLERSQPPLLTEMILAVYDRIHDRQWLTSTLPAILKLYRYWTTPPHLIPQIGLSRYYAEGHGPAFEVIHGEHYANNQTYYDKVREYYRTHYINDYDVNKYYDRKTNQLKPAFYIADRSVRESGFDLSTKYGPFGAAINDYAPVDLNSLLYQMEIDIANIYKILGNFRQVKKWQLKAAYRAELINRYCWDASLGYYFDYNYQTETIRPYIFATSFYPLWAGIANKEQAEEIVNNLFNLEAPGGIITSRYYSGTQWDAPFGWAPLQYFAVAGLARYGYYQDAARIASKFIELINRNFQKTGILFEKYNVVTEVDQPTRSIKYGYGTNQIGFGWTNGVYLYLVEYLRTRLH